MKMKGGGIGKALGMVLSRCGSYCFQPLPLLRFPPFTKPEHRLPLVQRLSAGSLAGAFCLIAPVLNYVVANTS